MKNKLKKIWNKEDGFTLVELLAVIVILGVILAIAIPGIGNIVDNAKKNTAKQQETLVIDAAQIYFLDKEVTGSPVTVKVTELISSGYLEEKEDFDEALKGSSVTRTTTSGKQTYKVTSTTPAD